MTPEEKTKLIITFVSVALSCFSMGFSISNLLHISLGNKTSNKLGKCKNKTETTNNTTENIES